MSSYEEIILKILLKANVYVVREKTFSDLKKGSFRFDFYIRLNNVFYCIEIDGQYHFHPIRGRQALLKQQEHDRIKNSYCLANDINLYRIPYWEINNIKSVSDILNEKYHVINKWHNDNLKIPAK
jgi:hypothetical protein